MVLSTIKPKQPERPEVKIQYNDRSYQEYIDKGFPNNIPHEIRGPHGRIMKFLAEVDLSQGTLDRTVTTMVRLKAVDHDSKKQDRREYLYWYERWDGKNWRGHDIETHRPYEHIEGMYDEVLTRPKYHEITGYHIENEFAGTRKRYYIPFSKQAVEDIIKNSARSNKSNIRFVVKFGVEDSTDILNSSSRNQFSHDMFCWSWDKLYEYQTWPVDDMLDRPKAFKTGKQLEFKPS